jgi:hypothetical protein
LGLFDRPASATAQRPRHSVGLNAEGWSIQASSLIFIFGKIYEIPQKLSCVCTSIAVQIDLNVHFSKQTISTEQGIQIFCNLHFKEQESPIVGNVN